MIFALTFMLSFSLLLSEISSEKGKIAFQQHDYKLDFERVDAVRYNHKALRIFEVHTFKYNRTCTTVNVTFEAKIDIGYDLEFVIQSYSFLSNEYRLFPMRFQINFCEGIDRNYAGFSTLKNCGNFSGCPITKGRLIHMCHFVPDATQLPPLIPDARYMIEVQATIKGEEVFLVRAYGKVYRPIPISE